MASQSPIDVVVIGAGPAGTSAARELTSLGHRVALLTRPAARPFLAETIPPSTSRLLQRLGLQRDIDAAGFVRSTGNTVLWSGAEGTREALYSDGALGYQVDRGVLNHVLLDAVKRTPCVVIDDATVTAVDAGVVRFSRADREEEIRARWVLDCSGRSGVVARRGWRRALPAQRTLAIVGMWERRGDWPVDDPTHTIVESHAEGWAWSVPASRSERHVTVMVDPRVTDLRAHNALADGYQAELRRVPGLRHLTRGARLVGAPFARDASPYTAHQVAEQGTLLVGDAASFVDPLSSYGIKKALASAWLASVVVNTALCDASMARTAMALYESRERAIYAALERQRAALAQAALAADATSDFWASRVDAEVSDGVEPNEEPNVEVLRDDPAVRAAFEEIKRRESIDLSVGQRLQRVREAAVLQSRVVLEPRLRLAGSERAIRFVRNVDLVALADLAPDVRQVPELYEAYCQRNAPVPLPDFLGALAFLVARGFLEFA